MGLLERARRGAVGSGERSLLVAEELALDEGRRDGPAVEGDEGPRRTPRRRCTVAAATSFPEPLSPVIITGAFEQGHPGEETEDL